MKRKSAPESTSLSSLSSEDKVALLNEVGSMVLSSTDLDGLLGGLANLFHETLGLQYVMIGTIDHKKGEVSIRKAAGVDPVLIDRKKALSLREGIIGQAIDEGRSVVVNDVLKSSRYVRVIPTTRSEMCIPLKVREQRLGFLNLESDLVGAFDRVDVEFFEAVGSFLGQAIRNTQLRQELNASKHYIESVIENAGDAIVTFDTQGRILTWNSAAERVFGRPRGTVMWRNVADLIQSPIEGLRSIQERVLSGEVIDSLQMKNHGADGALQTLELSMAPVRDPAGDVIGISGIIRDVTEKIRAQSDMERNLKIKQLLIEIAKEMTAILDLDDLLHRVDTLLQRVIEYEVLAIFLYDTETDALQLKVSIGYGQDTISRYRRLPLGVGVLGRACKERRTILSSRQSDDPEAVRGRTADGTWTESELAVPIISQDRLLGGLAVESRDAGYFKAEHVDILEAMASHIAVSIDNARLFEEVRVKEQKLESDFALARDLQFSMLPISMPSLENFEVAAAYKSAESLGGDYYDFVWLEPKQLAMAIGDVSGKGVAAAMTMAATRSALRFAARLHSSPSQVLYHVNRRLYRDVKKRTYVTLFYAVLDVATRMIRWSNAGHFPPMLLRKDGTLEELSKGGVPVALFDRSRYVAATTQLDPGDVLCFYTDGVVEATNATGEELGKERLSRILMQASARPAREILGAVMADVEDFMEDASHQNDDITMLILKVHEGR